MAAPTISGYVPINGEAGITQVVISGTNLDSVYSVRFVGFVVGSSVEANFTYDAISTDITCTAPLQGAVTGLITVVNADGEASTAGVFTFDVTTPGVFNFITAGETGLFLLTTEIDKGSFLFTTAPESGLLLITTESGAGTFIFRTTGEQGLFLITTVPVVNEFTADLKLTFDPLTSIAVIEDVTTWGVPPKPIRPTLLLLDIQNAGTGKIIKTTPNAIPESVIDWTTEKLEDGIYVINLKDGLNQILRTVLFPVTNFSSGVQGDMEIYICEQMKCNKHDYSDVEYWTMRALNEAIYEASEVLLANQALTIFNEAQAFADECALRHKKIDDC